MVWVYVLLHPRAPKEAGCNCGGQNIAWALVGGPSNIKTPLRQVYHLSTSMWHVCILIFKIKPNWYSLWNIRLNSWTTWIWEFKENYHTRLLILYERYGTLPSLFIHYSSFIVAMVVWLGCEAQSEGVGWELMGLHVMIVT